MLSALEALKPLGFDRTNFVGGEPFLVQSMPELIKAAKVRGWFTSVVTNGSLLTEEGVRDLAGGRVVVEGWRGEWWMCVEGGPAS